MALPRILPALLLRNGGLYKTVRFDAPKYVGDPINAVRIFNDKECDELILVDIGATNEGRAIDFDVIAGIASEAFMPMCYGGGVRSLHDFERLFDLGIEKVAVNTAALETPELVKAAAAEFGSQSVVVAIDVRRRRLGGRRVYTRSGTRDTGEQPVDTARRMEDLGAGELLVTSIDHEGTGKGYDVELMQSVAAAVDVPVIANGGAGSMDDIVAVMRDGGVAAAAAGSLFVFQGKHRAVLISYPLPDERERLGV